MNVVYVHPRLAARAGLGQLKRRAGVLSGLRENGHVVSMVELDRRRHRTPEVLSVRPPTRQDREVMAAGDAVLVVEGLAAALSCVAWVLRHRPRHVHVDVCDSWMALAAIPVTDRRGAAHVARWVKLTLAWAALTLVARVVDSLSYISEGDRAMDARVVPRAATAVVVPNTHVVAAKRAPTWDPDGPVVVIGDWAYPPNIAMLRRTIDWLESDGSLARRHLRVVGPNLRDVLCNDGLDVQGWVDDLEDAYDGVCCALALVGSGAGVKNKVLEPLAWGIPLAASETALLGVEVGPAAVFVVGPETRPRQLWEWLDALTGPPAAVALQEWSQAVSPLIDVLQGRP